MLVEVDDDDEEEEVQIVKKKKKKSVEEEEDEATKKVKEEETQRHFEVLNQIHEFSFSAPFSYFDDVTKERKLEKWDIGGSGMAPQ